MTAIEVLKIHNVKKTASRVAIIQALQTSHDPLSEHEIKEIMGELYNRITFFRTAQTLEESGIIHRIVVDNTLVKYALNHCGKTHNHQPNHVHFYCTNCKSLVCMEDIKTQNYELPEGYSSVQCDVVIKGICKKCDSSQ